MQDSLLMLFDNMLHMLRGAILVLFLFFSMNLYTKRNHSILNFLFWLYVIMAAMLFVPFGFMSTELKNNAFFCSFRILLDQCLVPLVAAFLFKIIIPNFINSKRVFFLLLPTIILLIIYLVNPNDLFIKLSFLYTTIVVVGLLFLVVLTSKRTKRYLKNNYSNIDNKVITWFHGVIVAFVFWYIAWCAIVQFDDPIFNVIYYLTMTLVWIFIYLFSIKRVNDESEDRELYGAFSISEEIFEAGSDYQELDLGQIFHIYLNEEQPWLNPTLTLQDLATALNTNRTYLSEYFNKTLGTTFYDYFNHLRVKTACELLLTKPNWSMIQVGEKSGFNSLSTFRRSFEKHMGCSPAKYRNQKLASFSAVSVLRDL